MKDSLLIEKIRSGKSGREEVIRHLFSNSKLKEGIKKFVLNAGGSDYDYRAMLNLSFVELIKRVLNNSDFSVSNSLVGYIIGISKNLWLQELRKKSKSTGMVSDNLMIVDAEPTVDLLIADKETKSNLRKILGKLGKNCKEVLLLWSSGIRMKEIASRLNYASEGVARKKKFKCMQNLLDYLDQHPAAKKSLL